MAGAAAGAARAGPGARWRPAELIAILEAEYGRAGPRPHGDAMSELVLTLLSQNTSDHNSGRAFHRLLARFPDWDAVLAAPEADVVEAIRPGGLAPTKGPRLQALIAAVRARAPGYRLGFLAGLPLEEAKAWLRALPGVGPKTAAIVLLFALGRPALPVDTHVERGRQTARPRPAADARRPRPRRAGGAARGGPGPRLPRRPDPARAAHLRRARADLRALPAARALPARRPAPGGVSAAARAAPPGRPRAGASAMLAP